MEKEPKINDITPKEKQKNLDINFNEMVSKIKEINKIRKRILEKNPDQEKEISKIFGRIFDATYEKEK